MLSTGLTLMVKVLLIGIAITIAHAVAEHLARIKAGIWLPFLVT